MRRKHNPIVSLAAFLLLAVILVLVCAVSAGCAAETKAADTEKTPDRFACERVGNPKYLDGLYIITDNETGVQYLMVDGYNGIGLTVLQPGEG